MAIPAIEANAQTSVTAEATAEVIQSLTATEGAILNFGRFSPESAGGDLRLSPDGARSVSGSIVLGAGLYNPATFYLTGQPEYTVSVSLPAGPVLLTNSESGQTMEIVNWEANPTVESGVTIPTGGTLDLNVGATLRVGNMTENPVGIYAGTYTVTFSYN